MNPFLSKRFLILTFIFSFSLLLTLFIFIRGGTEDWQWQNHNENSVAIGSYDFATTFPSEKGMLIIAQKSSRSSYYYSYSPYETLSEYDYQILFADNQGVHFITYGDQSFYNAVCERNECLIMLRDGYRTINLTNFSVSELIPWGDKPSTLFSTLIMGKIYQSKGSPFYVVADNENIFISTDKGMTWEHFMNVRDLAKSLFPEEIAGNSNFSYATYRDKIVMWYSYGNQMGSLEVIMDIPTKQVISSKWLPVRINESAQNRHGDIFVVAQEPSRRLFSLMQFQTNGDFDVIAESGYNHLNSLKVGNQGVIVSNSVRGSQQYLMMDIATKEIRYRPEYPLYNKIYNMTDQSLIEIESSYSNESNLTKGTPITYQSLH
ncbi:MULTISPECIES: hypothetical protein [Providencia]|uniref:hypothetical protein n=1 Tax=Providencia TaxID=586 RepID=UPI0022975B72|nr:MULTISPECIES: hypothetical protein [Providencia]MCL0000894.1 hypothetical protein [Providencia rettgeri]HCT9038617.1 hypothetical protein [Providencia rettgeri]